MSADVRTRVVAAFHGAATAAKSCGDRPLQERLDQLAVELGHHDTSEATLAGLMQAFAGTTTDV